MRITFGHPILLASCAAGFALLSACSQDTSIGPSDGESDSLGVSGSWATAGGGAPSLNFQLVQTGSSVTGAGTIGVAPLAPVSGPSTPAYTGDNFTITSGTFNAPNLSFTASLGANPDGAGGFYRGTLTFNGTLSGTTIVGTATFTPPRTATQIFSMQTMTGATLTRF